MGKDASLSRKQRRALKRARKGRNGGVIAEVTWTDRDIFFLAKILDVITSNSAVGQIMRNRFYRELDENWTEMTDDRLRALSTKLNGIDGFLRLQHKLLKEFDEGEAAPNLQDAI